MDVLELKSPIDGSILAFRVVRRDAQALDFEVSVTTPWCSGRAPASTFRTGAPTNMFKAMAQDWRGWTEPKLWQDLEMRVFLSSLSDTTGHVLVTVELTGQDYESKLRTIIQCEAGQLQGMANGCAELFG